MSATLPSPSSTATPSAASTSQASAGSASAASLPPTGVPDRIGDRQRRVQVAVFALIALALAIVPLVANNFMVQQATFVCLFAALALSWNFIGGYAGYPSFATAAFVGLGSYAGALLQNAGLPMVVAWVAAGAIVAAFSALLGMAILRMKGHYFAVGSITVVEVLRLLTSYWSSLTGGGEGLNLPILPGGPDYAGRVFLYAMLAVMVLAFAATWRVDRGRLGFALRCIEQNEDAADMVGVDVNRAKIAAFVLSAVFCGLCGAISASWVAYIAPGDAYSTLLTLKVPVMVILGGAGTLLGPVLGAAAFVAIEQTVWARFLDWNQAILGVIIVLLVFWLPGGLMRGNRQPWLMKLRAAAGLDGGAARAPSPDPARTIATAAASGTVSPSATATPEPRR